MDAGLYQFVLAPAASRPGLSFHVARRVSHGKFAGQCPIVDDGGPRAKRVFRQRCLQSGVWAMQVLSRLCRPSLRKATLSQ